ncbi:MAG: cobalt-precorrin-5B (C(1))-methyltransferase CbiD [Ruminococcus sp.]|nr:cobalt-precorrin-5B (C(1))-methyltransferase CbiD [Ruminococcus sp.]
MNDIYIYKNGHKMRCGYTTGSCATGATKASAEMLLSGKIVKTVNFLTPKGIMLELVVNDQKIGENASCSIVKDGGDDPDSTDGMKIFSEVSLIPDGVEISGGIGIGIVTQAGLDQPVGEWAINTVPRKMIRSVLAEISRKYAYSGGFKVVITAPEGQDVAKKTYNPRMGIEGGISILGTSGIVEPMSSNALIETIRTEAKMKRMFGDKNMIITLGNYGDDFLRAEMPFLAENSIKCSNFIGDAIEIGMEMGYENILIIGHIGKLVKLGAGIMNTHSGSADGRMDVLVTCGLLAGADADILRKIPYCVTVDSALDILREKNFLWRTMKILSIKAGYYLKNKVYDKINIGTVMFSYRYGILVRTDNVNEILRNLTERT